MLHYGLTEFKRENTAESDKRVAHVIWAAHILSYLSGNRSHIKSRQPEDISEDEELEPDDIDVETVRAGVIQAPRDSVRSKFLDCIAQLLSPSKGWDAVTASALREQEDFVEVDVARNDCFGTNTSHSRVQHDGDLRRARDYCTKLQNFLSQHSTLFSMISKLIMILTKLAHSFVG